MITKIQEIQLNISILVKKQPIYLVVFDFRFHVAIIYEKDESFLEEEDNEK